MHSLLQKFLCKQDNCIRSFSSISDLRKHLDKNHSELSVTQPNLEAAFENHALASTSRCSNCLPHTQKNKDESTVDPPDAHLDNASLVGHLYSIPSLSRNIVQLVLDHISELINSIFESINNLIITL
jgi:hypothetical protein